MHKHVLVEKELLRSFSSTVIAKRCEYCEITLTNNVRDRYYEKHKREKTLKENLKKNLLYPWIGNLNTKMSLLLKEIRRLSVITNQNPYDIPLRSRKMMLKIVGKQLKQC